MKTYFYEADGEFWSVYGEVIEEGEACREWLATVETESIAEGVVGALRSGGFGAASWPSEVMSDISMRRVAEAASDFGASFEASHVGDGLWRVAVERGVTLGLLRREQINA